MSFKYNYIPELYPEEQKMSVDDLMNMRFPEQETSNGSTAHYYDLPKWAKILQDLISYKDMNAQIGTIFSSCYRYGQCSHSDRLREIRKVRFYAKAEEERLLKLPEFLTQQEN